MYRRKVHGKELRLLREQADLPRQALATAVGISVGYAKNIEIGLDQPSGELVFRWLRVLSQHLDRDVPLDEISTSLDPQAAA